MRLYMPRFYVRGLADNLAAMERDAEDAASLNCDCVVFPEQFLTGYYGEGEPSQLRGEFERVSKRHSGTLFIFGTISEDGVNRLCVYFGGSELAHYDKVHLFLPGGEDKLWQCGDRYVAIAHGKWRIGLAMCNDVRFPEQARALKLKHDINLLLYPALWPWQRDDIWATLLRARSIENGCYTVGCCVAGVDNGSQRFDGAGNHVFDPLGYPVCGAERVYELDAARLNEVLVDTRAQHCEISQVDWEGL